MQKVSVAMWVLHAGTVWRARCAVFTQVLLRYHGVGDITDSRRNSQYDPLSKFGPHVDVSGMYLQDTPLNSLKTYTFGF